MVSPLLGFSRDAANRIQGRVGSEIRRRPVRIGMIALMIAAIGLSLSVVGCAKNA